jgi:hypothetical protein
MITVPYDYNNITIISISADGITAVILTPKITVVDYA